MGMGQWIGGKWADEEATDRLTAGGSYKRVNSKIRGWVTEDGLPGPSGEGGFRAEAGRYHLYISLSCPFAHRAAIMRRLKKLEDVVSISVAAGRTRKSWVFDNESEEYGDAILGSGYLYEVYTASHPDFTGRVTVPVLWDKNRSVIVSNESSEIIRMFNSAFNAFTDDRTDYYPEAFRPEIDELNDMVFESVNTGVYRAGFAGTQAIYDQAFDKLFDTLDQLDERLGQQRYLVGEQITEADWRLFPTLARFDVAYHGAFKCNKRRLVDYPNLWPYARDLYQVPGVAETVDLDACRESYYTETPLTNPLGIVPKGPHVDFSEPHRREAL